MVKLDANIKGTNNDLEKLQEGLMKECQNPLGLMNPSKAFMFLNALQKEDCPEAYEPEIVIIQKKRNEIKRLEDEIALMQEKTLFDFDEEVDHLSLVSERYKVDFPKEIENDKMRTIEDKK